MRWTRVLPVFFWCGLIFFLSSQSVLPGPDDTVLDFIFKKSAHMFVYGVLFFLVYRCLPSIKTKRRILYTFLFCILYAVSDEIHQSFVPGRGARISDVGIDAVGMIVSWLRLLYARKA